MKRKKLAGGLKKIYLVSFLIILFFCKSIFSSQIYDYQTDIFIEKIISQIISVNNYNKKVNYKIINDNFPNAFVTEDNTLYLSSGLIIHSQDYVSFLAVIAHEIGHLEKFHLVKRKNEINNLEKISSIGNLATIAGSMLIQNPELVSAIIVNQTSINNLFIKFSQNQEKEADIYAVETLNKLNLPTESVRKFLHLLEDKTNFDLIDIELRKFSTHPLFKERREIITANKNNINNNFDKKIQNEFNFIKAKFMAYTNNEISNYLTGDHLIYKESIKDSLSGNLIDSLEKINSLLSKKNNDLFIIETKADILMSYGYKKEAIDFYLKVLNEYPHNNYVRLNIFLNSNTDINEKINQKNFTDNLLLMHEFPNHKGLINKFYKLSKNLGYKNWINFFEILLFDKNNLKKKLLELDSKIKDNNLKKIIKLYI